MATSSTGPIPPTARRLGKAAVRTYGVATAALRGCPDFLIVGCKRGGTTSLYRYLLEHPNVLPLFPSARRLPMAQDAKGVHYFDVEHERGPAWYRSHFPTDVYRRLVAARLDGPVVTGEASPYYLFHPLAAARAAAVLDEPRIVVLLRDPVERAYSHYKEQRRNGVETLGFEEALAAETARLAGQEELLRRGTLRHSFAHQHQSYVAQGRYLEPLREWVSRFGRERVLVLRSEDFFTDPAAEYDRVLTFLGLPPHALAHTRVWNATPTATLPPHLRGWLREQLADDVEALERYLGRSMGWWV